MNWKESGRKRPWHSLRCYPDIFREVLSTTTITSVTVFGDPADIRSRHPLDISHKRYRLGQFALYGDVLQEGKCSNQVNY